MLSKQTQDYIKYLAAQRYFCQTVAGKTHMRFMQWVDAVLGTTTKNDGSMKFKVAHVIGILITIMWWPIMFPLVSSFQAAMGFNAAKLGEAFWLQIHQYDAKPMSDWTKR